MHPLPFTFKRIHHRLLAFARPFAKFFDTTPARYDLLVRIGRGAFQSYLPSTLGVTRATVSRMLIALERLGLITRKWIVDEDYTGRRTKLVKLSEKGQRLVQSVRCSLAFPWFQTAFEQRFNRARRVQRRSNAQAAVTRLSRTMASLAHYLLDEADNDVDTPKSVAALRIQWTSIADPFKPNELARAYSLDRRVPWPPIAWPPDLSACA